MKKTIVSALALSLMSSVCLAQTTPAAPTPMPSNSPTTDSSPTASPSTATPSMQSPTAPTGSAPRVMTSLPSQSTTVTNWYKQSIYDTANASVGQVMDVLLSPDGKVAALIVGVGGFLGMGDHNVAVPFDAVKQTTRDSKTYLTMNMTKDALKNAPGLRYDSATTSWMPDTK